MYKQYAFGSAFKLILNRFFISRMQLNYCGIVKYINYTWNIFDIYQILFELLIIGIL